MKYLYEKYYIPNYAGILPSTSGIPPNWDEIEDVLALCKSNNKFIKKEI